MEESSETDTFKMDLLNELTHSFYLMLHESNLLSKEYVWVRCIIEYPKGSDANGPSDSTNTITSRMIG